MTRDFATLAADPNAPLDALALALAGEFRAVDTPAALATLDELGRELAAAVRAVRPDPRLQAAACAHVLGEVHGFVGDTEEYDRADNSMLDLVLERRRGLPILLSVVYVEVARRAYVDLRGVGLPGHFVVGHFASVPPLLLDPFRGGAVIEADVDVRLLAPWSPHAIAMRMLNNLVGTFRRRGMLTDALRAAQMRLQLPADADLRETLELELRGLRATLN